MKRNGSTFFVVMVAAFIALFSTLSVCYVNADDYAYDYKVKYVTGKPPVPTLNP